MKWPTPPTVGDRVRRAAPEGELGRLYHVRAIVDVDDNGFWHVVLRTWSNERQDWAYVIECAAAWHVGLYKPEAWGSK